MKIPGATSATASSGFTLRKYSWDSGWITKANRDFRLNPPG